MNWLQSRPFRAICTIILSIFIWEFVIFDVAVAATRAKNTTKNFATGQAEHRAQTKQKPEGKLQKAIEDIVQIVQAVQAVQTVEEKNVEKNKLKIKKLEIEALDVEIRKQFKEIENRIKDLPNIIKQRHRDFVIKYEENFNELKANLEAIDRAETEVEIKNEVEKLSKYLKKVKPPKKHIPLDPNKLPHRTPEVKKPELIERQNNKKKFKLPKLRTKRAELNYSDKLRVTSNELKTNNSARLTLHASPILVASNGSLTGLLDSPILDPQSSTPIQIALADPPMDADLLETIEVQFTPAIIAKAEELEHKPVKLYNWVRNNIEFVPTYGSIQGADMCLQTKLCNAFDTASLLIALLRASGIHARYVYGTIEIPIDMAMNWVGNFTDPNSALSFIASGGIPVGGLTSGGKIVSAQLEHIWVKAWVDMIPSQGAVHKQGDMWVPLDASFKQYSYTEGIDIQTSVPFDAETFINQIQETATINETEGYVTGVDSLFIQQTMENYQTQVENYLTQNHPDATAGDVLGKKEIIKQEFPVLAGTLPYKRIGVGAKYSDLPDNLRHKVTFSVALDNLFYDASPLIITKSLPEIAGKKITLSYSPATQADEDVINSYLPQPHEDGTPIDPSELPTSLPAYLINLNPELRIDGEVVATGGSVMMGLTENFVMSFTYPGQSGSSISNFIEAGEYLGIALDLGRISEEQMLAVRTKLASTKTKLETQDFTGLTKDDIVGDLLYTTALSYYVELDMMNYVQTKTMGINITRLPSMSIFSFELEITTSFYDIPMSAGPGGLAMDVDQNVNVVKALDGDTKKPQQFMLASGQNSSALEHSVPEQMFSTPENPAEGISAVKALKIANEQGIPIYTINQSNIDSILPQLQVDADVKSDILNAVYAGKIVTVSKTDITFNGWTGSGYIIVDPITGAGAYMISGGINGGILLTIINALLSLFVTNAEADEPYKDIYENYKPRENCAYLHPDEYRDCILERLAKDSAAIIIAFLLGYAGAASATLIGIIGAVIVLIIFFIYFTGVNRTCSEEATHCD